MIWVSFTWDHPQKRVEKKKKCNHQVVAPSRGTSHFETKFQLRHPNHPINSHGFLAYFISNPAQKTHLLAGSPRHSAVTLGTRAKRPVSDPEKGQTGRRFVSARAFPCHIEHRSASHAGRTSKALPARAKGMKNTPEHSRKAPSRSNPSRRSKSHVCHLCFDRWEHWRRTCERLLSPLICSILLSTSYIQYVR